MTTGLAADVGLVVDDSCACADGSVCMQIHHWYEQTTTCRHVYIERHFGGPNTQAGACETRCDYCRRENVLCAIVNHFEDEQHSDA